jgi:hypothetical protein
VWYGGRCSANENLALPYEILGEILMTLKLMADLVGWMLFINIILLIIGFLKVTLFKKLVKNTMDMLFGDQSDNFYAVIPKALVYYEILIIVFNLVPYLALRIVLCCS